MSPVDPVTKSSRSHTDTIWNRVWQPLVFGKRLLAWLLRPWRGDTARTIAELHVEIAWLHAELAQFRRTLPLPTAARDSQTPPRTRSQQHVEDLVTWQGNVEKGLQSLSDAIQQLHAVQTATESQSDAMTNVVVPYLHKLTILETQLTQRLQSLETRLDHSPVRKAA